MSNTEKAVRDAEVALNTAIVAARADGYRITWQVDSEGVHSLVINGGPEPSVPDAERPAVTEGDPQDDATSASH